MRNAVSASAMGISSGTVCSDAKSRLGVGKMAVSALRSNWLHYPKNKIKIRQVGSYAIAATILAAGAAGCNSTQTAKVASPKPTVVSSKPKPVKSKPYVSQPKVQTAQISGIRPGGGYQKLGKPYRMAGKLYVPQRVPGYDATGIASWYGKQFHGRLTANGERFDKNAIMAAHPTMPLPSYARVTNLENGKSIIVRVNDRGPYAHNRLIDVSERAARILDFRHQGTVKVRVQYIGDAPLHGKDEQFIVSSYQGLGPAPKARNSGSSALSAFAKPPSPRPVMAFSGDLSAKKLDRATVDAGTPFDPFFSIGKVKAVNDQNNAAPAAATSFAAANRVSGAFEAIDNLIR